MKQEANPNCYLCKGKGFIKEYAEMGSDDIETSDCDCTFTDEEQDEEELPED